MMTPAKIIPAKKGKATERFDRTRLRENEANNLATKVFAEEHPVEAELGGLFLYIYVYIYIYLKRRPQSLFLSGVAKNPTKGQFASWGHFRKGPPKEIELSLFPGVGVLLVPHCL